MRELGTWSAVFGASAVATEYSTRRTCKAENLTCWTTFYRNDLSRFFGDPSDIAISGKNCGCFVDFCGMFWGWDLLTFCCSNGIQVGKFAVLGYMPNCEFAHVLFLSFGSRESHVLLEFNALQWWSFEVLLGSNCHCEFLYRIVEFTPLILVGCLFSGWDSLPFAVHVETEARLGKFPQFWDPCKPNCESAHMFCPWVFSDMLERVNEIVTTWLYGQGGKPWRRNLLVSRGGDGDPEDTRY